jgi:SH3-like domain-containing protein
MSRHCTAGRQNIRHLAALVVCLLAAPIVVHATDYISVAENAAILYDAPSIKAKKLFVVSRYMPMEQVVALDNWVKVHDNSGGMAWIEKRAVSSKRFVLTTVALATIHQKPEEHSPVIMQSKQQVALEWLENSGGGWLKVRLLDGVTGYVKSTEVWGG